MLSIDLEETTHASHALIHPMYPLEHNRIKRQKQVENAVDERHVQANRQYNWLRVQKPQRPRQVLLKKFAKVNFDFFLLGVDAPVARSSS